MKRKPLIISYLMIVLFVSIQSVTAYAQSASCSQLDETRVGELLREAARLEQAGDEAGSQDMMNQVTEMYEADLTQALQQNIPDPAGLYCKPNPTTDYVACVLKLTARVELTGNNPTLTEQGMARASQGIDFWTSQFAHTVPPVGNDLCKDYLACIFKAMAQRELIALEHSQTDDLLQAKANEILEKGCDPCETKWVAVGKVDIEWRNDDEHVTIAGYAQWENFHLIANISELEDKCMHFEYDDRITFPYACDGGVITHKGGKIKTRLTLTDGDETFAKDIVDAHLTICAENTVAPKNLRLLSYIGFSEHGQSVEIDLTGNISSIKARRPFTVTEVVRIDASPSYIAKFKFMFYPVSGWETSDF